jgi:preprotein translocase subunit SecA
MSGTISCNVDEIELRYGISVISFPPNRKNIRVSLPDLVHKNDKSREEYVARDAIKYAKKGNAVLIAATAMSSAESIAAILKEFGHESVLVTAKNNKNEAESFAKAGIPGRITVTTAIAGRGVDIVLGNGVVEDKKKVVEAGGLVVLGIGHFSSERLDRQLIGRCARQGDPGLAQFHVSLDDATLDLPDAILATLQSSLAKGPEEIRKFPSLARMITIAQSTYDSHLQDWRSQVTRSELPFVEQKSTFHSFRKALISADRSTLIKLSI